MRWVEEREREGYVREGLVRLREEQVAGREGQGQAQLPQLLRRLAALADALPSADRRFALAASDRYLDRSDFSTQFQHYRWLLVIVLADDSDVTLRRSNRSPHTLTVHPTTVATTAVRTATIFHHTGLRLTLSTHSTPITPRLALRASIVPIPVDPFAPNVVPAGWPLAQHLMDLAQQDRLPTQTRALLLGSDALSQAPTDSLTERARLALRDLLLPTVDDVLRLPSVGDVPALAAAQSLTRALCPALLASLSPLSPHLVAVTFRDVNMPSLIRGPVPEMGKSAKVAEFVACWPREVVEARRFASGEVQLCVPLGSGGLERAAELVLGLDEGAVHSVRRTVEAVARSTKVTGSRVAKATALLSAALLNTPDSLEPHVSRVTPAFAADRAVDPLADSAPEAAIYPLLVDTSATAGAWPRDLDEAADVEQLWLLRLARHLRSVGGIDGVRVAADGRALAVRVDGLTFGLEVRRAAVALASPANTWRLIVLPRLRMAVRSTLSAAVAGGVRLFKEWLSRVELYHAFVVGDFQHATYVPGPANASFPSFLRDYVTWDALHIELLVIAALQWSGNTVAETLAPAKVLVATLALLADLTVSRTAAATLPVTLIEATADTDDFDQQRAAREVLQGGVLSYAVDGTGLLWQPAAPSRVVLRRAGKLAARALDAIAAGDGERAFTPPRGASYTKTVSLRKSRLPRRKGIKRSGPLRPAEVHMLDPAQALVSLVAAKLGGFHQAVVCHDTLYGGDRMGIAVPPDAKGSLKDLLRDLGTTIAPNFATV